MDKERRSWAYLCEPGSVLGQEHAKEAKTQEKERAHGRVSLQLARRGDASPAPCSWASGAFSSTCMHK